MIIDYFLLIIFKKPHFATPHRALRRPILQLRALTAGLLLSCLITLTGCTKRPAPAPTPQMNIEPPFQVRVLLLDNTRVCTLKADSPLVISDPCTQTTHARFDRHNMPINVSLTGGKLNIAGQTFEGNEITILPDEPYIFNLNGDNYRGRLKLILNPNGESFIAVNIIPIEPYLAGVVGAEMPAYWEEAAIQAQAIAARTYCLYTKKRFGNNRSWDVRQTAANQVYLGVKAESPRVWNAVNQTKAQVLFCRQNDDTKGLFPAYYCSSCGGHTENSNNVFGDSYEPLVGVPCPYCKDVARPNFFLWPPARFDKKNVTKNLLQRYPKLQPLGEITNIVPARQSNYEEFSRLLSVELFGSTGKNDSLRAEDFRLSIDPAGNKFKSTVCKIDDAGNKWIFNMGRGFGHGVGMCQCGAQAMARQGKTTSQILSYYYPGCEIVSIY